MLRRPGAHYYSFSGDQYAEEVTPLSQPVLSASSSAGVVYDAGGESLFLFQDGQEDFSLDVDGTLLSARVNDSGWLAVTAQQSGYKARSRCTTSTAPAGRRSSS